MIRLTVVNLSSFVIVGNRPTASVLNEKKGKLEAKSSEISLSKKIVLIFSNLRYKITNYFMSYLILFIKLLYYNFSINIVL